jgi:probable F420-dependent oxidoreductase
MLIGFGAPNSGSWATPAIMTRVVQRAEELGYHSLWTFQRLLSGPEWLPQYRSVQDPLITLAYLAAQTQRIRLGVAVLNMPFASPVLTAKQLTTLDIVSGGRLDIGLGNGWSDEEFPAVGAYKEGLGKRAEEYLLLLRKLFRDEFVEHEGRFYSVPRSTFEPKPGSPPILLGGSAPSALRRAGRFADGWISSSRTDLPAIAEAVRIIKLAAEGADRDPEQLRFVTRKPMVGSFEQTRADLGQLEEAGVTEVFLDLNFNPEVGSPDADPARSLELAERVMEEFSPRRQN